MGELTAAVAAAVLQGRPRALKQVKLANTVAFACPLPPKPPQSPPPHTNQPTLSPSIWCVPADTGGVACQHPTASGSWPGQVRAHLARSARAAGESWRTAATPMENPCCSCKLTRVRPRCSNGPGWSGGCNRSRDCHAAALPSPPVAGVSIVMERERQQNDRTLVNGYADRQQVQSQ